MAHVLLLLLTLFGSLVSAQIYGRFARKRGIVATPNFRTLHQSTIPRGGGLAFAGAFTTAMVIIWVTGELSTARLLAIGVGGGMATAIGFIDDVLDIRASVKLCCQICLSVWFLGTTYPSLWTSLLSGGSGAWATALSLVFLFVPVWMINLFNFIDGVDGMAISASLFACSAAAVILHLTGGDNTLVLVFALLAAASLGFGAVNRPPAAMFMGDAGSIFLGYVVGALLLMTVMAGHMSIWTWMSILAYFIADTTMTTLSRMVLVKRWYGVHRSHAYQNLARILQSHATVTYGVLVYNVLWAFPLAVWSAHSPAWAPTAAACSIGPAVLWTLWFGPRLSST